MTTAMPPARFLHLVVGYDGSPPASRALDAAVRLLQDRTGRIDVVYVAHLSSLAALSADAIAEVEKDACQAMNGMSSAGMVTKGRIMSRSSCSRMWQWYM